MPKGCCHVSWAIGEFFKIYFTLQLLTRSYYRIMITCNDDDDDDCNNLDDTEKRREKKAQEM